MLHSQTGNKLSDPVKSQKALEKVAVPQFYLIFFWNKINSGLLTEELPRKGKEVAIEKISACFLLPMLMIKFYYSKMQVIWNLF